MEVAVNEYGVTELSFFRFQKCVMRFKLRNISAADLISTESGFHCIARAAAKAFYKLQTTPNFQVLSQSHLPMVLVLIQQEKRKGLEFDVNRVLLQ